MPPFDDVAGAVLIFHVHGTHCRDVLGRRFALGRTACAGVCAACAACAADRCWRRCCGWYCFLVALLLVALLLVVLVQLLQLVLLRRLDQSLCPW